VIQNPERPYIVGGGVEGGSSPLSYLTTESIDDLFNGYSQVIEKLLKVLTIKTYLTLPTSCITHKPGKVLLSGPFHAQVLNGVHNDDILLSERFCLEQGGV